MVAVPVSAGVWVGVPARALSLSPALTSQALRPSPGSSAVNGGWGAGVVVGQETIRIYRLPARLRVLASLSGKFFCCG